VNTYSEAATEAVGEILLEVAARAKLFRAIRLGFLAAAVNSGSAVHNFVQQESESAKNLSGYYLDVDAGLL
jgi:hypothetical protein